MYEQDHEAHNSINLSAIEQERESILKNLVEVHHLLSQYQGAFKTLHTFIAGLTLQKHPSWCHKALPGEICTACYVCESQTMYEQYEQFQTLGEFCKAKLWMPK